MQRVRCEDCEAEEGMAKRLNLKTCLGVGEQKKEGVTFEEKGRALKIDETSKVTYGEGMGGEREIVTLDADKDVTKVENR